MKIGENIRKYRLKRNMTQEQLAIQVGITAQAVSKWECGETIPDGMLFIPIADALGVSLDCLCGHERVYEADGYAAIIRLVNNTPFDKRMEKVREICWQTEKALFGCIMEVDEYKPDEMAHLQDASSISDDTGFTCVSNRLELPFFTIFPEPADGYADALHYDEKYRELFEALSDEYVLKAFFFLYAKKNGYIFEKEVLAKECVIPETRIDATMNMLCQIGLLNQDEYEMNDEKRVLFTVRQRYELVAMLALLNEYLWHGKMFSYQVSQRRKPYLAGK